MAFTGGPLACPNCRMKIEPHDRYAWRVAAGQYSCPGCGHHFPGRDFIDTATPIKIFTMTERATELGRVGEALDWLDGEHDRLVDLEREFEVEARRIAKEIESHSRHRPFLYLCILADTLADALRPLRSYAQSQGQEVRVVQSAAEIIETLAESTHIILDITAGLRWLPSKILLDAKWGDHLVFDEEGVVFAGQSGTATSDSTNVGSRAVPDRCYLHFFCDRPFNPPPWFAERLAGRVFDFRSSR